MPGWWGLASKVLARMIVAAYTLPAHKMISSVSDDRRSLIDLRHGAKFGRGEKRESKKKKEKKKSKNASRT